MSISKSDASDPAATLGSNLRSQRESAGLTQRALAESVGVSQPAIAQIESGAIRNPTLDVLVALAKVLGVTVNELVRGPAGRGTVPAPHA
jgi:transcriptional regulator with XRE-family HTH domain